MPVQEVHAVSYLVKLGFVVLPYCQADPTLWKRIVAELGNHWTVGKARYAYSRVCALCFAPRKRKGECHGLYCKTMPLPWNLPGLQEKGE